MPEISRSTPLAAGLALTGFVLYNATMYRTVLDQASPGMPWELGSYLLGAAALLLLVRRGWKPMSALALGVALVALLLFALTRVEALGQGSPKEAPGGPVAAFSARMEGVQSRVDALGINRILRPEKLLSERGIADSRQRLVRFAALIDQRDALVRDYFEANPGVTVPGQRAKWAGLSAAQRDTITMTVTMLDFVAANLEQAKARKDDISFKTPELASRYEELTRRMSELERIEIAAWKSIDCLNGRSRLCA